MGRKKSSRSRSKAGSGSATAAAPAKTMATNPTNPTSGTSPSLPVVIKVSFTLTTPDHLRQISFGLEKDSDGVTVNWTLTFVLFERSDPGQDFGDPLVSLTIFVARALHDKAEAASKGLTPPQTAHATGPAADAAKKVHEGTMPLPVGNKIIQDTLNK